METDKILIEAKDKLLAEAISFISIKSVDVKFPIDGSVAIYIKTDNLETVEIEKMKNIAAKYSEDSINTTFLLPEGKVISGAHEENLDLVCIYLRKKPLIRGF
jgi:hypothetical protein